MATDVHLSEGVLQDDDGEQVPVSALFDDGGESGGDTTTLLTLNHATGVHDDVVGQGGATITAHASFDGYVSGAFQLIEGSDPPSGYLTAYSQRGVVTIDTVTDPEEGLFFCDDGYATGLYDALILAGLELPDYPGYEPDGFAYDALSSTGCGDFLVGATIGGVGMTVKAVSLGGTIIQLSDGQLLQSALQAGDSWRVQPAISVILINYQEAE